MVIYYMTDFRANISKNLEYREANGQGIHSLRQSIAILFLLAVLQTYLSISKHASNNPNLSHLKWTHLLRLLFSIKSIIWINLFRLQLSHTHHLYLIPLPYFLLPWKLGKLTCSSYLSSISLI